MAVKTHYSNGEWRVCTAQPGNCPLGGDEGHRNFSNLDEMKAENAKITEKRGLEQSGILPGMNSIQAVAKFQVNKFFDAFARVSDQVSDSLLDHKEARLLTKKEKINAQLEAIRLRRLSEGDNRQAKHKSTVNLYELSDRQKAR